MSNRKELKNSIWPNTVGRLGVIKVPIPDGTTETWPIGDTLKSHFIFEKNKLVGFVDTKALTTSSESTYTLFDYETIKIELPSIVEGELTYKRSDKSINFSVKYKEVDNSLPDDYIPADFLHAEIGYNTMELPLNVNSAEKEVKITTTVQALLPTTDGEGYRSRDMGAALTLGIYPGNNDDGIAGNEGIFLNAWSNGSAAVPTKRGGMYVDPGPYYNIGFRAINGDYDILFNNEIIGSRKNYGACDAPYFRLFGNRDMVNRGLFGKKKEWKYFENGKIKMHLIPAVTPAGQVCMYDIINHNYYLTTYGTITAGFTLEQATKLYKLPNGGGSISVMLPSGYSEVESVVNALKCARDKGWNITVKTYETETSFYTNRLRNVWVRKNKDEEGQYVDRDGYHWQVDWCYKIYSSETTEEEQGFSSYPSVESACEEWGLTLDSGEPIPVDVE